MFSSPIGIAVLVIWAIVIIGIIGIAINGLKKSKEKQLYKVMVANPCDTTVRQYIAAFEKTFGFFGNLANMDRAVAHRNNMMRQSQGWEVVNMSKNVSPQVKEQLRNVFIANGVPIKDMAVK